MLFIASVFFPCSKQVASLLFPYCRDFCGISLKANSLLSLSAVWSQRRLCWRREAEAGAAKERTECCPILEMHGGFHEQQGPESYS